MSGLQNPSLAEQQRYWNTRWENTRAPNEWSLRRGAVILELLQSLRLARPKILDLGCGTGWFTEKLALHGDTIGIDLSDTSIAAAKARAPHLTFIAGNLFDIPFSEQQFDVVIAQEVIAHVEDQRGFLGRVASLLGPGGHLILTTPNRFVLERAQSLFRCGDSGHIEQWLGMKGLKQLVRLHFRVLRTRTILPLGDGGVLRIVNSHKLNTFLETFLSRKSLDAIKERAGLGYTLAVLAKKGP